MRPLSLLFVAVVMLPTINVAIRRMHDINYTGWLVLLNVVPIIGPLTFISLACVKGNVQGNRFGPSPMTKSQG